MTNNMNNKFYTTEGAKVNAPMPRQTRNMTAVEIVAYCRDHYNMNYDEHGRVTGPANKTTAYMKAVADAIFDPSDWKNAIRANVPDCGKDWAKAAIIWFHGAEPRETFAGVISFGYAC